MLFFFFNDTATTEIYTLSLHDALPISDVGGVLLATARDDLVADGVELATEFLDLLVGQVGGGDRKSTRLNSSHANISYAVFCLKKKKRTIGPWQRAS